MRKIRKGDEVIIKTGKDKGKKGTVLKVFTKTDAVLVQGLNLVKKHVKPNPSNGIDGGVVNQENPVHISNVALFNSATQKIDRIRIKVLEDGSKVRVFRSSGEALKA
ncbi:MAG: 50S ribosomal protein L24 [Methylophilaceae bacterium]|nr:50S ribosomal protein L24 [Methylophilaceae bacterium]